MSKYLKAAQLMAEGDRSPEFGCCDALSQVGADHFSFADFWKPRPREHDGGFVDRGAAWWACDWAASDAENRHFRVLLLLMTHAMSETGDFP